MVKEKGPPESSVFTKFKKQTANTKLVVSDKQNDIVTSSRVSIISKNPQADTTPNISVNRFINSASEPFVEDVPPPPPPPLTETFTSQTFIGFDTAIAPIFLSDPSAVAVDGTGNVFIADTRNHRILKVAAGTGIITTVAGTGTQGFSGDGVATNVRLNFPIGVAVDGAGNIFIADTNNHRVRKVTAGTITTVAGTGTGGYIGEGVATNVRLNFPRAVAVDGTGNVFIADTNNHRVRKVAAGTGIITTVAGTGTAGYIGEGVATEVRFNEPNGVAVDGAGNIFIADINNHRVRKVTAGTITTVAGRGYLLGTSRIYVSLSSPRGVTVKGDKIYVTDTGRHSIYVLDKNTGFLSITYGNGKAGLEIVGEGMIFNQPYRVAVESTGNIIVADNTNNRIRRVLLNGANSTIIAGGGADTDTSSGPPTSKRLNRPNGVAVFGSILYFTNTGANTVCKVQGGNISNLPGSYSAPEGIAVDSVGNVYVANTGLNQISIVATDNSVTNITFSDGTIPRGVAVDGSGSIYIADGGMNRILRLKTDSSSGLVSNIIMATELNNPMDVSVDTDGTLYVADYGNNKIMKIVTTFV